MRYFLSSRHLSEHLQTNSARTSTSKSLRFDFRSFQLQTASADSIVLSMLLFHCLYSIYKQTMNKITQISGEKNILSNGRSCQLITPSQSNDWNIGGDLACVCACVWVCMRERERDCLLNELEEMHKNAQFLCSLATIQRWRHFAPVRALASAAGTLRAHTHNIQWKCTSEINAANSHPMSACRTSTESRCLWKFSLYQWHRRCVTDQFTGRNTYF